MVNLEDYIEVDVSERVREQARIYSRNLGELSGSIKKGKGNFIGYIGKIVVSEYLGVRLNVESKSYDFMYGGRRAAVKAKGRKGCPDTSFAVTVTMDKAETQDCEIYIFTCISYDHKKAWILGWYPKERYLEEAEEVLKGTRDARNGWEASADCYNMDISELYPLEKTGRYMSLREKFLWLKENYDWFLPAIVLVLIMTMIVFCGGLAVVVVFSAIVVVIYYLRAMHC